MHLKIVQTERLEWPPPYKATGAGIRYRFGAFPFTEPAEIYGFGLIRERSKDPKVDDNAWFYNPAGRAPRRVRAEELSDAVGPTACHGNGACTYANNLDPDSYFGFSAKIENYNYKLLGIKPMLASVHAKNTPAKPCQFDNSRTVCPEDWEMRQLYVIEATAKPLSWHQKIGSNGMLIPKRILYIDSEGLVHHRIRSV